MFTGLALEMLHIMQSRMERMNVRREDLAKMMGKFMELLFTEDFTTNVFKNQQTSTIAEIAMRFRCGELVLQCLRRHVCKV